MRAAGLALLLLAGCAPALREPAPLPSLPGAPNDALGEARRAWDRRPDPAAVERALRLYLQAAEADPAGTAGLLGAAEAAAWLVERERSAGRREELVRTGVQASQWCRKRDASSPACAYRLAIAVGQQVREHPTTAADGLATMMALLREAAAADPGLDHGGPQRVLALVLLRAPGWPAGPGDPAEGLAQARAAVAADPEHPPNLLALAEALEKTGAVEEGKAVRARALEEAARRARVGDPDAAGWLEE
ncbi:MAG TPA: hypothetical protein VFV75_19890 [Candidatus Polarisedimenticolaceae bacterium]|nr:hypothetical protein [Candidatus Polarisedimenticolaceae bacterium]